MSGLRALRVDSDKTRDFIDWFLDVPLTEGLFTLAGVMVSIGGLRLLRKTS